jgi:glycosyltransferase involved in cell wall biosynthesis
MMRLAVLISHPVQYYAPIFRELALRFDLHVYFGQEFSSQQHANAGFGVQFDWDIDLVGGYHHTFLRNKAANPGIHFFGCDTPEIGPLLRNGHYDALLVVGWYLKCLVQGIWAAKKMGVPIVVRGDSHLATPRSPIKRGAKAVLFPRLLGLFDAACYVGENSRKYYMHYGVPSERLFFSPHCVDTKWFAAKASSCNREQLRADFGIARNAKVLLFAGKLLPLKRPFDLITAAAKLRAAGEGIEVMMVGDGELRASLLEQALELRVPLHLVGFFNQTQMPSAYVASDVLVLPSSSETWGLVANEALACGCPIVVSDACGCAADLTTENLAGCSYLVGDVNAMADAISTMLRKRPTDGTLAFKTSRYTVEAAVSGIEQAVQYCTRKSQQRNRIGAP